MKISAKTEYACIAMLELSARYAAEDLVRIRDIAEAHAIPSRFLVQILLQLKAAGLVESTRGASGGYRLARSPEEITLADVVEVIDGPPVCEKPGDRVDPLCCALYSAWQQADRARGDQLAQIRFADLVEAAASDQLSMYYI
mgnify:FL=1